MIFDIFLNDYVESLRSKQSSARGQFDDYLIISHHKQFSITRASLSKASMFHLGRSWIDSRSTFPTGYYGLSITHLSDSEVFYNELRLKKTIDMNFIYFCYLFYTFYLENSSALKWTDWKFNLSLLWTSKIGGPPDYQLVKIRWSGGIFGG